jgi:hypothetical protein
MIEKALLLVLVALTLVVALPPITAHIDRVSTRIQCAETYAKICVYDAPAPKGR